MDRVLNMPEIKRGKLIVKVLLCIALFAVAAFQLYGSVLQARRYQAVEAAPLVLRARIVRVNVVSDEDSDTYDAIMTYTHDGVSYTRVYENYNKRSDAEAMVGRNVVIRVDPDSPGDTVERIRNSGKGKLEMGALVLAAAIMSLRIRHRRSWSEEFGWNMENARADAYSAVWQKYYWPVFLFPPVIRFAVGSCYPELFLVNGFMNAVGLIVAGIGVFNLVKFVKAAGKIRNGQIFLRRDTCVNKQILSDSEGSDSYFLTYSNGKDKWEKPVNMKIYNAIRVGDTVESACLEGEKHPIVNYTRNDGVF